MQTAKPPGVVAFGNSRPWIEFENTQGRSGDIIPHLVEIEGDIYDQSIE